jgi:GT2 family glycosyltransferase
MKSVSVIIPNFNGKNLFEKYLPFLFKALETSKLNYEIIVPDDSSKDDSIKYLEENYPEIIVLKNSTNLGFAGNCNRGIAIAKMDLIFLLNNDVKLTENYFESLLPYFEFEGTFGVMGALTTESNGKIQDGAKYPRWKGNQLNFTLNYVFKDSPQKAESLFLSGANALVDRKKIQMIGGFDEIFNPFYFEDAELGVRSWRLGWKNYFEQKAICYHEISSTIKKHNDQKKIKITARRNKFILHAIHLEGEKKSKWEKEIKWNYLYRWIKGDFTFYKALKEFRKKENEIKISKEKLEKLFAEVNHRDSLEKISEKILKSIGKSEVDLF